MSRSTRRQIWGRAVVGSALIGAAFQIGQNWTIGLVLLGACFFISAACMFENEDRERKLRK